MAGKGSDAPWAPKTELLTPIGAAREVEPHPSTVSVGRLIDGARLIAQRGESHQRNRVERMCIKSEHPTHANMSSTVKVLNQRYFRMRDCYVGGNQIIPINTISRDGAGTVTVNTHPVEHGLALGQLIAIHGVSDSSFDGDFTVATSGDSDVYTFTYGQAGPVASSSGGGDGDYPSGLVRPRFGRQYALRSGGYEKHRRR
jgi:hypothetical protein